MYITYKAGNSMEYVRSTDANTQHLNKMISSCIHCPQNKAEKEGGGDNEDLEESKLLKSWKDLKLGAV